MSRNRIIIIAAVIPTVVIVVGIFGYLAWKKSLRYSLNQVRHAFETHDLMKFEKFVDLDSVIARFVDQMIDTNMAKQQTNNPLRGNFAQGIIQMMKPQLQFTISQQIKAMVERGADSVNKDEEESTVNLASFFKKDDANLDYKGIESTKKEGKIATVTLAFYQAKTKDEAKLDVKMRQMDGYWQVAELPNASTFIDKVNAVREKLLAEKNKPIVEQMNKSRVYRSIVPSTKKHKSFQLTK